jgi:alpha-1,2-mannosyltransferase
MPKRPTVWFLGILFLGLYVYRNGVVVWPFLFRSEGDFVHFHTAGRALLEGASPYAKWLAYPPLLPLLMVPFGALDFEAARIAWFLVGHACILGAALLLWRPLGADMAAFAAITAVWALGGAAQETLGLGQVTPLLLLFVAWAFRTDLRKPGRSAAALGLAAAVKLWPGLLLAADLRPGRRRALLIGIGTAALGVAIPLILLMATVPQPWTPRNAGFWMGTPAPLNVSVPATALRLTYKRTGDQLPEAWQAGTHPRIELPVWRQAVTAGTAAATLLLGLAAARAFRIRLHLLAGLVALALLASPISWYHYQMMQFPGLALLTAEALRERAWGRLAGVTALEFVLTRSEFRDLIAGQPMLPGVILALAGVTLFGLLLHSGRRLNSEALMEEMIWEDVEWGLRGKD